MLRLIFLLLCITGLSLALAWIADEPGRVIIDWGNYHLETSLLVIIASVAALALVCVIIYTLFFALVRSPRSWMRSQLARKQALGLSALTDTFAAIATQDIAAARKQIARARQLLPHQPLTLMLAAQVARLEGNESQARLYLEQMLKAEGTEFMALRGFIENARRSHDDDAALNYAEKALAIKPQDSWLIKTLVGLYARKGRSQDALRLLEVSARKRYISRQEFRELGAYALYENALTLKEQRRWDFAIAVLEDTLRRKPDFAPASSLLAEAYLKQNEGKRALKALTHAWKIAPHPLLTEALMRCIEASKEQKKTAAAIEKLAAHHPEHRESRFLLATLAIQQRDFDLARRLLRHLGQSEETVRVCAMLAEIETMTENREQAGEWLKRAGKAANDPAYSCEACEQVTATWHLTCTHCGSVASYHWK